MITLNDQKYKALRVMQKSYIVVLFVGDLRSSKLSTTFSMVICAAATFLDCTCKSPRCRPCDCRAQAKQVYDPVRCAPGTTRKRIPKNCCQQPSGTYKNNGLPANVPYMPTLGKEKRYSGL